MKFEDDSDVVIAHAKASYDGAIQDVLADARAHTTRRTGKDAMALALMSVSDTGDHLSAGVGAPLVYGPALEFGANVGARKGPHMRGIHSIAIAVRKFPEFMAQRLRDTPMRSTK